MKKIIALVMALVLIAISSLSVSAKSMEMYVGNQYVVRNMETIGDFDMLPILDIAGELGYNAEFDGYTAKMYDDTLTFTFHVGDASYLAESPGYLPTWFGLDVVPQMINGQFMIPAKFLMDWGASYTWDSVTNTIFINSNYTYNWLINTYDYMTAKQKIKEQQQEAAKIEKNKKAVSNFYVGQKVRKAMLVVVKYGVVREIDWDNGKLKIEWGETRDSYGNIESDILGFYGSYTTRWENACEISH